MSRSLGTLSVDLVANIAGFTGPLSKAEREAEKRAKNLERTQRMNERAITGTLEAMEKEVSMLGRSAKEQKLFELAVKGATKAQLQQASSALDLIDKHERQSNAISKTIASVTTLGTAFASAFFAAGSAVVANTISVAKSAREIENLSRVANESVVEFQKLTYASKPFGVEQQQLADILKDVTEKIGDFVTTGQGPLSDFFQNIAPRVDLTADSFRNLSGSQALGLYISALESAGLSQAEMTFYLEAIASGSTALLPLFRQNSEALNRYRKEAEDVGYALSEIDIAQLKQADEQFRLLGVQAKAVGQEMAIEALPAIREFTDILSDPNTIENLKDFGSAAVASFSAATKVISGTVGAVRDLSESLAAALHGPAFDDIERLQKRLNNLTEARNRNFFSRAIDGWSDEELDAEIERLTLLLDMSKKMQADTSRPPSIDLAESRGGPPTVETKARFSAVPAEFYAELEAESKLMAGKAQRMEDLRRAGEDYEKELARRIEFLSAETEYERALYEVQKGRYSELSQAQKDSMLRQAQLLDDAAAQLEAEQEYKQLLSEIMTDEEKRTAQLRERLTVIDEMDQISYQEKEQVFGRVIQTSFDTDPEKPDGEGFDAQREAVQSWYDEQLKMLEEFRAERADLNAQWDEQEAATRSEYEKRLTEINTEAERDRRQQMAEGFSALLGVAEKFYAGMEGEEAAYTRAALQLGQVLLDEKKRESLEKILASTHTAAMGAYESLSSIPYIGPVLGASAAAGIHVAGGAASAAVMGMAHDGIDSVPQTGTWLLEKGERVTTAETSAKLDATLDRIGQGQGSGDVVINLIEDREKAGQANPRVDPANDQARIVDVFVANIQSDGRAAAAI